MPSAIQPSAGRYSRPSIAQAAADAIPILVDDEYHIFHLSTPPNTIRHPPRLRSTWSRLRSRDLTTWKRDEVEALYPGKSSGSPDADGAWTGCAIIGPDSYMHLFYTGYNLSQGGKQVILHARSNDKQGSHFTKTPTPISINGDTSRFEDIDFRDAYVTWMESENCYWMLVATRLREGPYWTRGCFALLRSDDLESWAMDSEPFYAPNDMFCPECPELFSLPNGKWYLVYSRFHAPDAGTVYRIADSPKGPFRTPRGTSGGRFDARRWYAAKSCPKAGDPSRRIYFGWVADKLDGQWSWGGDMGMPREISADENGHLIVQPNHEFLTATFGSEADEAPVPSKLSLSAVAETSVHFFPVEEKQEPCDYFFEFGVASQDAASFGVTFRTDEDMEGHRLRFTPASPNNFEMTLSKCPAPLDDFWADQYDLHLPREVDGPEIARHAHIDLRKPVTVTLRSDVLEIFAGGKSISYRLPSSVHHLENGAKENGHAAEGAPVNGKTQKTVRELGIFVEDGSLELKNICLKHRPTLL
ncbi:hypothetical protein N0V83_009606 [Neocucurbitaria cava]|uniref:beta-fructofuranosidase n=1 Tax=Neocucurbitaria cava TaxID=798079 RepID=A0A9W8Y2E9_9PLEO|nr:hypothetical protein N0V83_009606 [Neocucurbitaria cava]